MAAYCTCGVSWAAATAGMTETAVAHCRLGDNTCGALAGVCGSVGLRLIAIDEMVMAFFETFGLGCSDPVPFVYVLIYALTFNLLGMLACGVRRATESQALRFMIYKSVRWKSIVVSFNLYMGA